MIFGYQSYVSMLRTYGVIMAASIGAFIVRSVKFNDIGLKMQVKLFIASFVLGIVVWEIMRFINRQLDKTLPFEKDITKRIATQLIIGAMVGLSVRFVLYKFGEPVVPIKLDSMFLAATWAIYIFIPIAINLGFFAVHFLDRWKASIIHAERLEREKSQVQFDNLKNQLNPHFLFNALTSLNSLIFENQKLASQFLQHLSKVYRYVLQNKEKNFVSLQTELDFIQNYVFLLETRFVGALTIKFDIRADAYERAIVPVTLQILLENALKHNIVDTDRPLHVEVITMGDYLVVSNNLQVKKCVETSNKLGLENLKSLYRFLSEKPVIIESTETRFNVKVPLI